MANARHKRKERNAESEWDRKQGETHLQWQSRIARLRQEQRDRTVPLVSEEAASHGDYVQATVHNTEDGSRAVTCVNKGGTTIYRWINNGVFQPVELQAISHCFSLWEAVERKQPRAVRVDCDNGDGLAEQQALDELHRYKKKYGAYWQVFENICRFGMTANDAGFLATRVPQERRGRVKQTVCMVAAHIAIDNGY